MVIDLERTQLGTMSLKINMDELFRGMAADEHTVVDSLSLEDHHLAFIKVKIDRFVLSAPGLRIVFENVQLCIHDPNGLGAYDYRALEKNNKAVAHCASETVRAARAARAASDSDSEEVQNPSSGARAEVEEDDPLKAMDSTPSFAAHVISEWILNDCRIELSGVALKANLSSTTLPSSKFTCHVELQVGALRCSSHRCLPL